MNADTMSEAAQVGFLREPSSYLDEEIPKETHLLKCSTQKSMYFSEPTGSPNSSQSQFLPLMMDDQLATSLSSTFFAPTKIFLFLK